MHLVSLISVDVVFVYNSPALIYQMKVEIKEKPLWSSAGICVTDGYY